MNQLGNFALYLVSDILRPESPIQIISGVDYGNVTGARMIHISIHHEAGFRSGGAVLAEDAEIICALAVALNIPLCQTLKHFQAS